tara:strand:- start:1461 stop:1694 length:234 start_codon:yes stop_codon:yes gene_type:complete
MNHVDIPENYEHIMELSGKEFDIYSIDLDKHAIIVPKEPIYFTDNEDALSFMKEVGISYQAFSSIEDGILLVNRKML